MKPSYMTREGYKKLEEKLNHLVKVKRKEIAKMLQHAREFGDLRENAEYNAAKEEQTMNERKIAEISAKLTSTQIIDNMDLPHDKVYIGATVVIQDMATEEVTEYTLVSEAEADFNENKISVTSPIGKGLLGCMENDVVDIQVPAGILKYKILKITR